MSSERTLPPESLSEARQTLREVFGHSDFRPGQEALAGALIEGRDCLGVMPTGAGKSVCYQVPALVRPGTALVISPLISLMKDQVAALISQGVAAAYINSSLTPRQTEIALSRASQGAYRIIYVAPERLETASFRAFARAANLSLIAVDEAHCVSQWGQDFRPHYLRIADFIDSLPQRPPVGAFTATATVRVREDIVRYLRLRSPETAMTGFDRPNLWFEVLRPQSKDEALAEILRRQEGKSGIVYCGTRRNVERVAAQLQSLGFAAARYHAGLPDEERRTAQEDFQYDRAQVMVATNAFGMGIDKSNVSFVVHYNMPKSMEAYCQEAGRAGRDGEEAECVLLYSPADTISARHLITSGEPNPDLSPEQQRLVRQNDLLRLNQMDSYCQTEGCLRAWILRYFGQSAPGRCEGCAACAGGRYAYAAGLSRKRKRAMRDFTIPREDDFPPPEDSPEDRPEAPEGLSGLDALLPDRPESLPMKEGWKPGDQPSAETLFDTLRSVRIRLSGLHRVPPYIICEDKSLRDMAEKLPLTQAALTRVHGFGERKAAKYGPPFLQAVADWVKKHPEAKPAVPETSQSEPESGSLTPEETAILKRAIEMNLNWVMISSLFGRPIKEMQAHARSADLPEISGGAYEPWTEEEDRQLLSELEQGLDIRELSERHRRTKGAIRSRIKKLTGE